VATKSGDVSFITRNLLTTKWIIVIVLMPCNCGRHDVKLLCQWKLLFLFSFPLQVYYTSSYNKYLWHIVITYKTSLQKINNWMMIVWNDVKVTKNKPRSRWYPVTLRWNFVRDKKTRYAIPCHEGITMEKNRRRRWRRWEKRKSISRIVGMTIEFEHVNTITIIKAPAY